MKIPIIVRLLFMLFAAVVGFAAEDAAALRARMEKRRPAVLALMNKQLIGENNRGFLEARGSVPNEVQQVVAEENSDRINFYRSLAAESGGRPEQVGREQATEYAVQARRGHWVQDASGDWRQK